LPIQKSLSVNNGEQVDHYQHLSRKAGIDIYALAKAQSTQRCFFGFPTTKALEVPGDPGALAREKMV
jgi:hypothetical protein